MPERSGIEWNLDGTLQRAHCVLTFCSWPIHPWQGGHGNMSNAGESLGDSSGWMNPRPQPSSRADGSPSLL